MQGALRNAFFFILIFVISLSFKAQKSNQEHCFYRHQYILKQGDNTWSYSDLQGNILIAPGKYEVLSGIDEQGFILARKDGRWGYITITEKICIPFIYSYLTLFNKYGLAHAEIDEKIGFINRSGTTKIPIIYDRTGAYNDNGLAVVSKGIKCGVIDTNGRERLPTRFEKIQDNSWTENYFQVAQNGKWAFYSLQATQLSDFRYDSVSFITRYDAPETANHMKGLILVYENDQYSYLNQKLQTVIASGGYEKAWPFNCEMHAIVGRNKLLGAIDTLGRVVIPISFNELYHPTDGITGRTSRDFIAKNRYGTRLYNHSGEIISDTALTSIQMSYVKIDGQGKAVFLICNSKKLKGVVDEAGIQMIPCIYNEISPFKDYQSAVAFLSGKCGLVAPDNTLLTPLIFDQITPIWLEPYYRVNLNGKFGLLGTSGELVVPLLYERLLETLHKGELRFIATLNKKVGIIDTDNKTVVPFEYDEIDDFFEYGPDAHFVMKNGKRGMIAPDGLSLIPAIYDSLFYYSNRYIVAEREGKKGVIDLNNKIVIPLEFDEIYIDWGALQFGVEKFKGIYAKKVNHFLLYDGNGKLLNSNIPPEEIKRN